MTSMDDSKENRDRSLSSDNRFKAILDAYPEGIYIVNKQYEIEYVNPALKKQFGEINGRKCFAYFHDRKDACAWCQNDKVFSGETVRWEWASAKNGKTYDLVDIPLLNEDGSISKLEVFHDITNRRRAEEAAKQAVEEWERTFNSISDLVFLQDKDMNITKVNKVCAKALKMDPKDIIGKKCYELMHNLDHPWPGCPFEKTKQDQAGHSEEVDDPHIGIPLLVTVSPIFGSHGEFQGAVHIAKDISGRKQMESTVKVLHEYLANVIDTVPDPIFVKDREHRWVNMNRAFCKFMGRAAEEILNKSDYELFSKAEADVFWAKDEEVFLSGKENVNEEFLTDAQGVRRIIVTKKALYTDPAGKSYIVGIIRDITEQKMVTEELSKHTKELEIFYKASIGREERILELKKELARLRKDSDEKA